ncbi:hypothetical protein HDE_06497 [Halotydeus destructor]|nr:hypothetical protein HDE_06497 [Halotydeus destructor]
METERLESRSALAGAESMVTHLEIQIEEVFKPQIDRYKKTISGLKTCVSKLKLKLAEDTERQDSLITAKLETIHDTGHSSICSAAPNSEPEIPDESFDQEVSTIKVQLDESREETNILKEYLRDLEDQIRTLLLANDKLNNALDGLKSNCSKLAEKFCPVCFVTLVDLEASGTPVMALTRCGHILCSDCLHGQSRIKSTCPLCQTGFQENQSIKLFF